MALHMQVHCAEEAANFQRIASALLVNVGTLSPQWVAGMEAAIGAANELKKPWVLDPVAAGATPFRTEVRPCDKQNVEDGPVHMAFSVPFLTAPAGLVPCQCQTPI